MTWAPTFISVISALITIMGITVVCAGCARGLYLLLVKRNGDNWHWMRVLLEMDRYFRIGIAMIVIKSLLLFVEDKTWNAIGTFAVSILLYIIFVITLRYCRKAMT